MDQECLIAGFSNRLAHASTTTNMLNGAVETTMASTLLVSLSKVVEIEAQHMWLSTGDVPVEIESEQPMDLDSLSGMSGGGCWTVEMDRKTKQLKLALCAVHTATQLPKLRQTPMVHHLQLLAGVSSAMKEKVAKLWPETRW